MIPTMYYLKSKHDFGQHGLTFLTEYCAKVWVESKFGKGGYQEGLDKGRFTIEKATVIYYPSQMYEPKMVS